MSFMNVELEDLFLIYKFVVSVSLRMQHPFVV